MDIESYVEKLKGKTLYEQRNPDSLPTDILALGAGRVNEEIGKTYSSTMALIETYPPALRDKLEPVFMRIVSVYQKMDGWAVLQAISAEGQRAMKEQEEKKKGLLGWLP